MKKMMKLTALMLTAAMAMTGCGGGSEEAAGSDAAYKVGISYRIVKTFTIPAHHNTLGS